MSFMGFQDHDDEEFRANRSVSTKINYIWMMVASTVYFVCGLVFTERDLFSTAHWWDSLNIQPAGISSNYLFSLPAYAGKIGVSAIAIVASLGIWSMQVVVGFALAKRGDWSPKSKSFREFWKNMANKTESFSDINQEKLILAFALLSAAIIDTATDIAWLGSSGRDLGQAIFTSLFFHNFVSELAVFFGGKMMVESFLGLLRRQQQRQQQQQKRKGGGNQPHSQNQQRPQQQRPSGHRPTNLPQINRGGRPNQGQQQQRRPIDFMSDDYQE